MITSAKWIAIGIVDITPQIQFRAKSWLVQQKTCWNIKPVVNLSHLLIGPAGLKPTTSKPKCWKLLYTCQLFVKRKPETVLACGIIDGSLKFLMGKKFQQLILIECDQNNYLVLVGRFCLVKKPNPAKAICPEERNQQVLPNCPSDGCYWKIELI